MLGSMPGKHKSLFNVSKKSHLKMHWLQIS